MIANLVHHTMNWERRCKSMKKARLIYNPMAGKGKLKAQIPNLLERLNGAGFEATAYATTGPGDATDEAGRAVDEGVDLIIAAGGDGTISEVINGIAPKPKRPAFAIIPAGTTNDFARALGIPKNYEKAIDVIVDGYQIPIDIGKGNDEYFVYLAGGGRITNLSHETPSKLKKAIGRPAYFLQGAKMLPQIRHEQIVRIEYDDEVFEGDILLFFIANTNSIAGFEKLTPDAIINDGKFDLLIVKKLTVANFLRLLLLAFRGAHLKSRQLIYTKASRIKVETKADMILNLDGENGGKFPREFVNLHQHMKMFVPKPYYEKNQQMLSKEQEQIL